MINGAMQSVNHGGTILQIQVRAGMRGAAQEAADPGSPTSVFHHCTAPQEFPPCVITSYLCFAAILRLSVIDASTSLIYEAFSLLRTSKLSVSGFIRSTYLFGRGGGGEGRGGRGKERSREWISCIYWEYRMLATHCTTCLPLTMFAA